MDRDQMTQSLDSEPWDLIIIGGGATGLGIAVDAQTRGYRTLLLEQGDFAQATSSRSTKLVHGGVRYLKQGQISLVLEALRERGILSRNAPHLVQELGFVVPCYRHRDKLAYGVGLRLYDELAQQFRFSPSRLLSSYQTREHLPNLQTQHLTGGVLYYDGQFEDARMAVALAQTAAAHGATLLNYARVQQLTRSSGRVTGVYAVDLESGDEITLQSRVVINATGVFADAIRVQDDADASPMITASQGVHLVLPRAFLPGNMAMMIPQTDDGRIFFMIPWLGQLLVGTTDTPVATTDLEPRPLHEEIAFLLRHAARYLEDKPAESDILSVFAGLRPLAHPGGRKKHSKTITRRHIVLVSESGLVTVIGGKWTTYRRMAQETVDKAAHVGGLKPRRCVTERVHLHGWLSDPSLNPCLENPMALYGSTAVELRTLTRESVAFAERLHPNLPYVWAQAIWAVRHEMARTVEDVLARRTRALLLDARAAIEVAPRMADLIAQELGRPPSWITSQINAFTRLAQGYIAIRQSSPVA